MQCLHLELWWQWKSRYRDVEFVLCCFDQPDIYELEAKAARESLTKPRSIWGDLLLSIKFDLRLTTARECVALRESVIYTEIWLMLWQWPIHLTNSPIFHPYWYIIPISPITGRSAVCLSSTTEESWLFQKLDMSFTH